VGVEARLVPARTVQKEKRMKRGVEEGGPHGEIWPVQPQSPSHGGEGAPCGHKQEE
jgi:hypothetical protein